MIIGLSLWSAQGAVVRRTDGVRVVSVTDEQVLLTSINGRCDIISTNGLVRSLQRRFAPLEDVFKAGTNLFFISSNSVFTLDIATDSHKRLFSGRSRISYITNFQNNLLLQEHDRLFLLQASSGQVKWERRMFSSSHVLASTRSVFVKEQFESTRLGADNSGSVITRLGLLTGIQYWRIQLGSAPRLRVFSKGDEELWLLEDGFVQRINVADGRLIAAVDSRLGAMRMSFIGDGAIPFILAESNVFDPLTGDGDARVTLYSIIDDRFSKIDDLSFSDFNFAVELWPDRLLFSSPTMYASKLGGGRLFKGSVRSYDLSVKSVLWQGVGEYKAHSGTTVFSLEFDGENYVLWAYDIQTGAPKTLARYLYRDLF